MPRLRHLSAKKKDPDALRVKGPVFDGGMGGDVVGRSVGARHDQRPPAHGATAGPHRLPVGPVNEDVVHAVS